MMKKDSLSLCAILLAITVLSACGNTVDSSNQEGNAAETNAIIQETYTENTTSKDYAEYNCCTLKLGNAKVVESDNGKSVMILDMVFTNNSGSSTSCYDNFNLKVFQDGIACDYAFILGENNNLFGSDENFCEIQSGKSVTVQQAFELRNTSSAAEVEVYNRIYGTDFLFGEIYNFSQIAIPTCNV